MGKANTIMIDRTNINRIDDESLGNFLRKFLNDCSQLRIIIQESEIVEDDTY